MKNIDMLREDYYPRQNLQSSLYKFSNALEELCKDPTNEKLLEDFSRIYREIKNNYPDKSMNLTALIENARCLYTNDNDPLANLEYDVMTIDYKKFR